MKPSAMADDRMTTTSLAKAIGAVTEEFIEHPVATESSEHCRCVGTGQDSLSAFGAHYGAARPQECA